MAGNRVMDPTTAMTQGTDGVLRPVYPRLPIANDRQALAESIALAMLHGTAGQFEKGSDFAAFAEFVQDLARKLRPDEESS